MKLHELKPAKGAVKAKRRLGRGTATGQGKTAGRGQKGQWSRSGGGVRVGFEGGQMPLQRRVPKFGFKNINRVEYKAVNLDFIQKLAEEKNLTKVGIEELIAAGWVNKKQLVKVLAKGELTVKVDVEAHAFSATAEAAIKEKGGNAIKL